MKLTKKQLSKLRKIYYEIQRSAEFMKQERIRLAQVTNWPNGGDYTIRNKELINSEHTVHQPEHISLLCKDIGSDLCGLSFAKKLLEDFLDEENSRD